MALYKTKTTKDNKRKKVVKGKTESGNSKFKTKTNKKTGKTTFKTKTKAGKGDNTKKSKTKTVTKAQQVMSPKAVSSKQAGKIVIESLLKMAPTSIAAKKAINAIKKKPKMPKMVKMVKRNTKIKNK